MTAFNIVRFRVKPGCEDAFLESYRREAPEFKGFRRLSVVKTGERAYCFVGEWDSFDDIVAARPQMIARLDAMRELLEDLGGGLGVTDPVSGQAVVDLKP